MTFLIFTRWLLFLLGLTGTAIWLTWAVLRRDKWLLAVLPVSWLLNVTLFYGCRLAGWPADLLAVNLWSSVIHLQALLLLIGTGMAEVLDSWQVRQWRKRAEAVTAADWGGDDG